MPDVVYLLAALRALAFAASKDAAEDAYHRVLFAVAERLYVRVLPAEHSSVNKPNLRPRAKVALGFLGVISGTL